MIHPLRPYRGCEGAANACALPVVIDSFGVDAVLVAAFDGAVHAADWIVQRVDVHYELLHDCRQVGFFGQNVVPACAGAPIDEEGVVTWVG